MRALSRLERRLPALPPNQVATLLAPFVARPAPADVRAQALALRAMREARAGSKADLAQAERSLRAAAKVGARARLTQARLEHARGYLAFRRADTAAVVAHLNRAASLYPHNDIRRSGVFDTLGMHFQNAVGDLERARSYYDLSLTLKERAAGRGDLADHWQGIAITCGNLGRLELSRENFATAERWFRRDLDLVVAYGDDRSVPHVRNQLALALMGSGKRRYREARRELAAALASAPKGSITEAFVEQDLGRLALLDGDLRAAARHIGTAQQLARRGGYREVGHSARHLEGLLAARAARRRGDPACVRALAAFADAHRGYLEFHMPRESCAVAIDRAELLARLGDREAALVGLRDVALPMAERHLFGQIEPLARIEAGIERIDPSEAMRLRHRRMLGGLPTAEHTGRLKGERRRITVWTCDIRGFTDYCDHTDPLLVVDMLNRFFAAIGRAILDGGGCIDKYVGDNILAWFGDAGSAADVALAALERVRLLNTEREHLAQPVLGMGIGMATGEVVVGSVGFAGKLEHTMIGTSVNAACRLVGEAGPGQILIDSNTRQDIGARYACTAIGSGGRLRLKGLGRVPVYRLEGLVKPGRTRAPRR